VELNGINSNLNSVNNAQNTSVERISTGSQINQASDDASSLSISDALRLQRSDLSQSIQNVNQGIALTRIASDGIENQKEILEQISTKLLQADTETTSADGKEAIKREVTALVDQFKAIGENTKFNDKKLIDNEGIPSTLDISTSDETIAINIPDTIQIANELGTLIQNTDFNQGDITGIFDRISVATDELNETQSEFASTENQLESSARNSISEQVNLAKASSAIVDVDFGKEINDFSKANILTQLGYLVSTQANAAQEQNLKLLV